MSEIETCLRLVMSDELVKAARKRRLPSYAAAEIARIMALQKYVTIEGPVFVAPDMQHARVKVKYYPPSGYSIFTVVV